MRVVCHVKHALMLPEPCIISLFGGLIIGGYSQMIKTGIILLNVWVILLPRRKPFVSHGHSSPITLIFYCERAKLLLQRL